MASSAPADLLPAVATILREAGATFAFLFGSQARGDAGRGADLDVAAWWPADPPASHDVVLPTGVDLVVLNTAPLELAGRIALEGRLLFEEDPVARVRWLATTRKIYSDELPRIRRSHEDFAESLRRGR